MVNLEAISVLVGDNMRILLSVLLDPAARPPPHNGLCVLVTAVERRLVADASRRACFCAVAARAGWHRAQHGADGEGQVVAAVHVPALQARGQAEGRHEEAQEQPQVRCILDAGGKRSSMHFAVKGND